MGQIGTNIREFTFQRQDEYDNGEVFVQEFPKISFPVECSHRCRVGSSVSKAFVCLSSSMFTVNPCDSKDYIDSEQIVQDTLTFNKSRTPLIDIFPTKPIFELGTNI